MSLNGSHSNDKSLQFFLNKLKNRFHLKKKFTRLHFVLIFIFIIIIIFYYHYYFLLFLLLWLLLLFCPWLCLPFVRSFVFFTFDLTDCCIVLICPFHCRFALSVRPPSFGIHASRAFRDALRVLPKVKARGLSDLFALSNAYAEEYNIFQ